MDTFAGRLERPASGGVARGWLGERGHTVAALAAVVSVGLLSRGAPVGVALWDRHLGDALYAAAVYLGAQFVFPRWNAAALAAVALGTCGAIEAFQATGIPARFAELAPVRWLLGTHFAVEDLVYYAIGALMTAGLDERCREIRQAQGGDCGLRIGEPDAGVA